MKHSSAILVSLVVLFGGVNSFGEAIRIDVVNDRLSVSNGVLTNVGYVDRIFVEDDADGNPAGTANLQGFGQAVYWNVPSFNINGMSENSGLYIDVIARPVSDSIPSKERALWFWNPTTQSIEDAPIDNHFTIYRTASLQRILTGTDSTAPSRLKFAAPFNSDLGVNIPSLRYGIHLQAPPPAGMYGFFARLSSDVYAPSDPFLILVNNGFLASAQVLMGAQAINAAAAASLTGDFNVNGIVDAADYTIWRDGLGGEYTQANYTEWKTHFGQSAGAAASAAGSAVPEPTAPAFVVCALVAHLLNRSVCRS